MQSELIAPKGHRLTPLQLLRRFCVSDTLLSALEGAKYGDILSAVLSFFDNGTLTESQFHEFLGQTRGYEVRGEVNAGEVNEAFVRAVPISYCRQHGLIALAPREGCMPVLISHPAAEAVTDHLAAIFDIPIHPVLAPKAMIDRLINQAYSSADSDFSKVIEDGKAQAQILQELEALEGTDLLDSASRAPVIKLVNMVLFEAVKRKASDVHIQPFVSHVQIRFRIDGVLYDYLEVPRALLDEVVSRVKVIGKMDIAEKRLAQDGRTSVTVGDKTIDLRISIIPTSCGERAVLRLLDKSEGLYELGQLGMSRALKAQFSELIERPHGIVLVTGPTGSGKSTTLYAGLQHLDCREKNILTLEDPIEYQLPGISQTQVSNKKGMTFATGLRAVLRQDPDVIMVGEIRDEETARMAVQSSLTGHLVFSTLHTNDAAGAVTRLLDLGIEPYLVASSLLAVLAQRLVRVLCPNCRQREPLDRSAVQALRLDSSLLGALVGAKRGCDQCAETGYRGRKGIFELLIVDEVIRGLITSRAKASEIKTKAIGRGMTTLREDGVNKFLSGETTIEEVSRVAFQDELMDVDDLTAAIGGSSPASQPVKPAVSFSPAEA